MFHANHVIKVENYKNLVIASGHTNCLVCVCVCTILLWSLDLFWVKKLRIVAGKSNAKFAYPSTHHIWRVRHRGSSHFTSNASLTGCETTKKVGIKASGQQAAIEQGQKLLFDFGRDDLSVNMIPMAEYFLTKFISHATEFQTFDELRHHVYHIKNFQFAYSQSVLAMLSLVARTVCSFDHI